MDDSNSIPFLTDQSALFFDVDGTLTPIAARPDDVRIASALLEQLNQLNNHLGRAVALVSGRSVASLDHLTRPFSFCLAGQHGLEIRQDHTHHMPDVEEREALQAIESELQAWATPPLLLEEKGFSFAVHYRQAPDLEEKVRSKIHELVEPHSDTLQVQEGKMVIEIRLKGADKGTAVRQLMTTPPFDGRTPYFFGDDLTDEDGFKAVNDLGGISVKIGRGRNETAAQYRLDDVDHLAEWLNDQTLQLLHPQPEILGESS